MSTRIQLRRSTAEEWENANPVLSPGEPGFETNTKKLKIGDGTTPWQDLTAVNEQVSNISELFNDVGYITVASLPTKVSDLDNDSNFITTSEFATQLENIISEEHVDNWDAAYSWGNHSVAGYLLATTAATTYQPKSANLTSLLNLSQEGILKKTSTGWEIDTTDYITSADLGSINETNISNWNTAYSWGNHSAVGYLLATTAANNYQPKSNTLTTITNIGTSASNGYLRKDGDSWLLDNNTFLTTAGAAATYQPKISSVIPNSSSAAGTTGQLAYDSTYIYICVATNTWRRAAILPW